MATTFLPADLESDEQLRLWRYMKLSTLFLLLEGNAFFPSVATLRHGDPLEGDLHPDPIWLMSKLDALLGKDVEALKEWLRPKAEEWQRRIEERSSDDPRFEPELFGSLYVRELSKRRAVWCWFNSNGESAAMWSIYGHNGVAIRTTLGALRKALPVGSDFQIAQIRYADRDVNAPNRFNPESSGDDPRIHRPHLVKSSEYEFEQEVRVVTSCPGSERGALVSEIKVNALVHEIVFSPLLPHEEADALGQQVKKHEWTEMPEIRRSALLGERAIAHAETHAAINTHFGQPKETNLPQFLEVL